MLDESNLPFVEQNPYAAPVGESARALPLRQASHAGVLFVVTIILIVLLSLTIAVGVQPLGIVLLILIVTAGMRTCAWNWSNRGPGVRLSWPAHLWAFSSSLGLTAVILVIGMAAFLANLGIMAYAGYAATLESDAQRSVLIVGGASWVALALVTFLSWRFWPK